MNGDNNYAEITLSGYVEVGIKIDTFIKGIKYRKHIIILINKNTGKIDGSTVKNIN